jgi:hypothetical protein
MIEDGDRVDPAVTELSRYKGLLKAQVLENERLRERIAELDAFVAIGNEQQVAVENENGWLKTDLHRLDELMSAIAMEWVKVPLSLHGEVFPLSPLDRAIVAAAQETTGMHRRRKEGEGND